ncbi:hypothetical protein EBU99_08645 [bacterium]|nr:hypothetical protein [bacterium]
MAEVRKGKTEITHKPRSRAGASTKTAAPSSRLKSSNLEVKRLLRETQDQLSLIHGVLEELCERQEALAAWQVEFSKRLVTLQEAQWRSLEDLAGVDMGRPVEKAFGIQFDHADPEALDDQLDEAHKMMDQVNSDALPKRAARLRKRKDPLRPSDVPDDSVDESDSLSAHASQREQSPESIFVMPSKVDVH